MSGTAGLTCPECGRIARSESALQRSRRHWRCAAAGALILALGLTTTTLPRVMRDGWVAATPTPALRLVTRPFLGEAEREFAKIAVPITLATGLPRDRSSWQRLLLARHSELVVARHAGKPTSPQENLELSIAWRYLLQHPTEARIASGTLRSLIVEGRFRGGTVAECLDLLGRAGQLRSEDAQWALAHEDTLVRRQGVRIAADLAPIGEQAVGVLLTLLHSSPHEDIRVTAVELLGTFSEHEELFRPALEAAEVGDRSAAVRISAGVALDGDNNPRPDKLAVAMLEWSTPEQRARMARGIADDPGSAPSLLPLAMGMLSDPHPDVRLAAVEAMVAYRTIGRHGLDMLRRMAANDENPDVRKAAEDALKHVRRLPMK